MNEVRLPRRSSSEQTIVCCSRHAAQIARAHAREGCYVEQHRTLVVWWRS